MQILTSAYMHFKEPVCFRTNEYVWTTPNESREKHVAPRKRLNIYMHVYYAAEIAGHTTVAVAIKASSAMCKWSHCLDPKWHDLGRLIVFSRWAAMGEQNLAKITAC